MLSIRPNLLNLMHELIELLFLHITHSVDSTEISRIHTLQKYNVSYFFQIKTIINYYTVYYHNLNWANFTKLIKFIM